MNRILFRLILLFILVGLQNSVYSQFNSGYIKSIVKENYFDVEKKLLKDLQKKPYDIEMNFAMAYLYNTSKFPGANTDKAYEYILTAKSSFDNVTEEKEFKKLNKIPINNAVLQEYNDTICHKAMNEAIEKNTLDNYQKYLSNYKTAPESYVKMILQVRNELTFKIATEKNTVDSYQSFITNYPDALQVTEAVKNRNALAFARAKLADKIQQYKDFIDKYPESNEIQLAYDRIHEIAYNQAERENTSTSYKNFLNDFPSSKQYNKAFNMFEKRQYLENTSPGDWKKYRSFIEKFPTNSWKPFVEDSIVLIATKNENLEILNYCIETFKGDNFKKSLLLFYNIFTSDGEKMTLDMFYSRYDDEELNDVKLSDYKLAVIGDSLIKTLPKATNIRLFEDYIKKAAPKDKAYLVLRRLVSADIDGKDWKSASDKVKSLAPYFGNKNKNLIDLMYFLEVLNSTPVLKQEPPIFEERFKEKTLEKSENLEITSPSIIEDENLIVPNTLGTKAE